MFKVIDPHHPIDDRDQDEQPRPFGVKQTSEPEHDPALVVARDLDRRHQEQEQQEDDDGDDDQGCSHGPIQVSSRR
jgi:hypothetical protein